MHTKVRKCSSTYVGECGSAGSRGMPMEDVGLFHLFWQSVYSRGSSCASSLQPEPQQPCSGAGLQRQCDGPSRALVGHAVSRDHVTWQQLLPAVGPGAESGGTAQLADGDVVALFHDFGGGGHWQARPKN